MAGDDDVGVSEELGEDGVVHDLVRAVLEEVAALVLVHVHGEPPDGPRVEPLDRRRRLHQRATGGVDDDHALLHLRHRRPVDDVVGGGKQRHVQRDDVRLAEQRLPVHVLHAQGLHLIRRILVVPEEAGRAEGLEDPRGDAADVAGADDADDLAVDVEALEPADGEVVLADPVVRLGDLADDGEQQAHGELRHRVGAVGGDAPHGDAVLVRRLDVDVVEPGVAQEDELHAVLRQLLDHRGRAYVIDEEADRVVTFC
mmetsp:Transcript_52428/g.109375  ORF Transcript_52428/g.109375 Transcript_52428/m.109375 type:complete len:256 (+) Transcript_52428:96-863(+)